MTSKKNLVASVHARLLNHAKKAERPFQEVLQYYAMERLLYRLSCSRHEPKFVLKGALMMRVWDAPYARPTKDVDLLGEVTSDVDALVQIFEEICGWAVVPDGMVFHSDTMRAELIKARDEYPGVRLRFLGTLGTSRAHMQVDVGFGDRVVPKVTGIRYPTLLEFPEPRLRGYSPDSVVAEKFEAMVSLGTLNTRMKDFYDIWLLAEQRDFDGPTLLEAISTTFRKRSTEIEINPVALTEAFSSSENTRRLWSAFVRRVGVSAPPGTFGDLVHPIQEFLRPVSIAAREEQLFEMAWKAPGPWLPKQ